MSQTLLICKRALGQLFRSPMGYIILALFLVLTGFIGRSILLERSVSLQAVRYGGSQPAEVCRAFWSTAGMVMLLVFPIVTMGSLAGEKSGGTMELLLTSPLKFRHIVWGKFAALMLFFVVMLAPTGVFFGFVRRYGGLAYSQMFAGYLAALLLGAACLSLGVFVSALTKNQIIAAFATFGGVFIFWTVEAAGNSLPGYWRVVVSHFSMYVHYRNIVLGNIGLADVVYFVTFAVFFLGLTHISVRLLWMRGKWA